MVLSVVIVARKLVLQLLLNRIDLFGERVVAALLRSAVVTGLASIMQVLLDRELNERWLRVQVNAVLTLQVLHVIVEECLIVTELLPDRQQADLVDSGLVSDRLNRKQQLLGDVDDLASEAGPFRLGLYQSLLEILLLFLDRYVMLLEHLEALFEVVELNRVEGSRRRDRRSVEAGKRASVLLERSVPLVEGRR